MRTARRGVGNTAQAGTTKMESVVVACCPPRSPTLPRCPAARSHAPIDRRSLHLHVRWYVSLPRHSRLASSAGLSQSICLLCAACGLRARPCVSESVQASALFASGPACASARACLRPPVRTLCARCSSLWAQAVRADLSANPCQPRARPAALPLDVCGKHAPPNQDA